MYVYFVTRRFTIVLVNTTVYDAAQLKYLAKVTRNILSFVTYLKFDIHMI